MNIANKLTILRIILVPVYILFLLVDITKYHFWIASFVFVIASLTDMLDGKLARKYHLVSDFGKFADPLADKLLVLSAMICLSVASTSRKTIFMSVRATTSVDTLRGD